MKALVLSGGGSKGAYQAGALKHLIGDLHINYNIVCGVSVGAINAAFLSQFKAGQEIEASAELSNWWLRLNTSSIYKRWFPFGRWHALWQPSFYDSQPLIDLITNNISLDKIRGSGKRVSVGAVSLSSGKYTIFNQDNDNFIKAVIASASFPGMLKPIDFNGHLWADGGVKEITPIRTAIEMGASEIDIVITSPETRDRRYLENPNTIDVLKRSLDLSADKIMANDIEKVYMYNRLAMQGDPDRKVIKLNIIRPKNNLIKDLLDFTPSKIKDMMEKGYEDAKNNYTF
jgi:NTE family protein